MKKDPLAWNSVSGWGKIHHVNTNENKSRVAVLTLGNADFRARKIIRNKKGHSIMIKESILQEDVTILNVSVLNNKQLK